VSGRRRRHDSPLVLAVVGVVALDAAAALALATMLYPVGPAIVPEPLAGAAHGTLVGIGFWVAASLLGSFRVVRLRGHGVLTFHLPFVVAAMALGGPVGAGWVGLLGTFERRELREAPWYGVVHNHSVMSLAGVLGGVALVGLTDVLGRTTLDQAAVGFVAILAGTTVFAVVSVTLVAITVAIRDQLTFREVLVIHLVSYRDTAVAEAVLGWLLASVYVTVGWWAPLVCAVLVIALWRANVALQDSRTDPMTGIANRRALEEALARAIRGLGPRDGIGLLFIDVIGLKQLNDTKGYAYGDLLIIEVARRLERCIRIGDVAARLGGDEFVVLLRTVGGPNELALVAERIHDALARPIASLPAGTFARGTVGALFVDEELREIEPEDLVAAAGWAMKKARSDGLGVYVGGHAEILTAVELRGRAELTRKLATLFARVPEPEGTGA
jgi:diguanylate cyclase (GGDEF)-like protein